MAVGDIVSDISGTGLALTFQPAASVEIIITCAGYYNQWITITDGTSNSLFLNQGTATSFANVGVNMKVPINNTVYVNFGGYAGQSSMYSGIQTK
jgi:hypothetical protein